MNRGDNKENKNNFSNKTVNNKTNKQTGNSSNIVNIKQGQNNIITLPNKKSGFIKMKKPSSAKVSPSQQMPLQSKSPVHGGVVRGQNDKALENKNESVKKAQKINKQSIKNPVNVEKREENSNFSSIENYEQKLRWEAHRVILKKKKRKGMQRGFIRAGICFLCAVIIYAFLMGVIAIIISANVKSTDVQKKYNITLKITDLTSKKTKEYTINSQNVHKNGEIYISITSLCDMLSLAKIGDKNGEIMFMQSDGNYVLFTVGSQIAVINEVSVILSAPVYSQSDKIWIPVNFFTLYTSGIEINYDEESREMSVKFEIDEVNSSDLRTVYKKFKFNMLANKPISPIKE